MKSSARRSGKYKAKTDGDVTNRRQTAYGPIQKSQFRQKVGDQVRIEKKVKSILEASGAMVSLNHFYMNFGKKLDRIKATYHGGCMWDEACIEYGRWELRGLDKNILDLIVCNIMVSPCNPCPAQTGLPWTGQVTVYYANDDGTYQKGYTLTRPIVKGVGSVRFTDNGDGTVTDNATGLMWVANPAGLGAPFNAAMTWTAAIDACEALNHAGHGDWRLPNAVEFASIIDWSVPAPNPPTYSSFFTLNVANYWTSTTYAVATSSAWRFGMFGGPSIAGSNKTASCWAMPVRLGLP